MLCHVQCQSRWEDSVNLQANENISSNRSIQLNSIQSLLPFSPYTPWTPISWPEDTCHIPKEWQLKWNQEHGGLSIRGYVLCLAHWAKQWIERERVPTEVRARANVLGSWWDLASILSPRQNLFGGREVRFCNHHFCLLQILVLNSWKLTHCNWVIDGSFDFYVLNRKRKEIEMPASLSVNSISATESNSKQKDRWIYLRDNSFPASTCELLQFMSGHSLPVLCRCSKKPFHKCVIDNLDHTTEPCKC